MFGDQRSHLGEVRRAKFGLAVKAKARGEERKERARAPQDLSIQFLHLAPPNCISTGLKAGRKCADTPRNTDVVMIKSSRIDQRRVLH